MLKTQYLIYLCKLQSSGLDPTAANRQKIFDILTHIRHKHVFTRNIPAGEKD